MSDRQGPHTKRPAQQKEEAPDLYVTEYVNVAIKVRSH
jgi:hypothetical protein